MGIGKKPAGARESVELDALWPETEEAGETDWKMIFRHLSSPHPVGRGMSLDAIGNLTIAQLEFLLSGDRKEEPNSRKAADRHACGVFLAIMRHTGWTADRISRIPVEILRQIYRIKNKNSCPPPEVVIMQLKAFRKRVEEMGRTVDKDKPKRRYQS